MTAFRVLGFALVTLALTSMPTESHAQAGGYIEGQVVEEATGEPMADWVAVEVYDESGVFVLTQAEPTDATGRYRLGPIAPGTYRLRFFDARLAGYVTEWWQDQPDFATATPLIVAAGETQTGIDFVVGKPAVPTIAGYIEGTITDVTTGGPPSEGLPVSLSLHNLDGSHCTFPDGNPCTLFAEPGHTDAEGAYRIGPLAPGTYKVKLVDFSWFIYEGLGCPCFTIDGEPSTHISWWQDKPDLASADPVTVTNGETTVLDFSLRQSSGPLPGDEKLEGRIFDAATGQPLADWVGVSAYDQAGELAATQQEPTDGDGWYGLWLPTGTYRLEFQDARLYGYATEWWQDQADFASAQPVEVLSDTVAGPFDFHVAVPELAGGWIAGTIVEQATGIPIPAISWEVYDLDGDLVASGERTDGSGHYRTPGLGAGGFKIAFLDSAYFAYETVWFGGSDFESATVIDVEEGVEIAGINVSMPLQAGQVTPILPFGGFFTTEVLAAGVLALLIGSLLVRLTRGFQPDS